MLTIHLGAVEQAQPASDVRFSIRTLWETYRAYIVAAAVLVAAQTALIAVLVVQAARRRNAERDLIASQARLRTGDSQLSALGPRLLAAQEAERSRIARELHDDVSQQIAQLAMGLDQLAAGDRPQRAGAEQLAREASDQVRRLARTVHDLSHRLHPARLQLIGLVRALGVLRKELSQAGTTITVTHENVPKVLDYDLSLCVYRVVQEALQNALAYSNAQNIAVELRGTDKDLTLSIIDNGSGFDVEAAFGKGLGLISMSERVEASGGNLTIRSAPGAGTRVEAIVPLCPPNVQMPPPTTANIPGVTSV